MAVVKKEVKQKKVYSVEKNGSTYYLHSIETPRYYFAKTIGKNSVAERPKGYTLSRKKRAGIPMLVRIKQKD